MKESVTPITEARDAKKKGPSMRDLLEELVGKEGSDLHLTVGQPPKLRIDGVLRDSEVYPEELTPKDTVEMGYSLLTEKQKRAFETEDELDFSFGIQNLARFRGNVYKQRGCVSMAIRMIPFNVRTFQELGLPPIIARPSRSASAIRRSPARAPCLSCQKRNIVQPLTSSSASRASHRAVRSMGRSSLGNLPNH